MKTLALAMDTAFERYADTGTPEAMNVATAVMRTFLAEYINRIFFECQERMGIRSGDIDPLSSVSLDNAIDNTAEAITRTLFTQYIDNRYVEF